MIEQNKYGYTPPCASRKEKYISGAADFGASRKEKYISGAADFGAAARLGHGFHARHMENPYCDTPGIFSSVYHCP